MDYKYNRRYFESIHWLFLSFVTVVGIVLLFFYILIGLLILLGVGGFIFYKFYGKPGESDIDFVYDEQAQLAIQKGLDKIGLQSKSEIIIDPIVIHGPLLESISFSPAVLKGKDQEVRSSNHEVIVFYFSDEQVYFYKNGFSVIDEEENEIIGEIFYKDIVSVSISSITTPYFDSRRRRESFFKQNIFQLAIAGGTTIDCSIKNLADIEQQLIVMKDILRNRKNVS